MNINIYCSVPPLPSYPLPYHFPLRSLSPPSLPFPLSLFPPSLLLSLHVSLSPSLPPSFYLSFLSTPHSSTLWLPRCGLYELSIRKCHNFHHARFTKLWMRQTQHTSSYLDISQSLMSYLSSLRQWRTLFSLRSFSRFFVSSCSSVLFCFSFSSASAIL